MKNNLEIENKNNYNSIHDVENPNNKSETDNKIEISMRQGFIKKVFGILLTQLIFTGLICLLSMSIPEIANFQKENKPILFIFIGLSIILMISLFCFMEIAKKVPLNYFLCFAFTLCESYLVSYLCNRTSPKVVLMALAMTSGMVMLLTLYACVTKTDFTGCGIYLFIFCCIMTFVGVFLIFSHNKVAHIIFSGLGVILFSFYIVYDVQLIVGNHQYKLDYDDYIIGAIMLYIDIINLFSNLLNILR